MGAPVIYSGPLRKPRKRGPGFVTRVYTLSGTTLSHHKNDDKNIPANKIELKGATAFLSEEDPNTKKKSKKGMFLVIHTVNPRHTIQLLTDSEDELSKWYEAIKSVCVCDRVPSSMLQTVEADDSESEEDADPAPRTAADVAADRAEYVKASLHAGLAEGEATLEETKICPDVNVTNIIKQAQRNRGDTKAHMDSRNARAKNLIALLDLTDAPDLQWTTREAVDTPLPADWSKHLNATNDMFYFYNNVLLKSSWDSPLVYYFCFTINLVRLLQPSIETSLGTEMVDLPALMNEIKGDHRRDKETEYAQRDYVTEEQTKRRSIFDPLLFYSWTWLPSVGYASTANNSTSFTIEQVIQAVKYLKIDPTREGRLFWILKQALLAPLPPYWEELMDANGIPSYICTVDGFSTYDHPSDLYFELLIEQERRIALEREPDYFDTCGWIELLDESGKPFFVNLITGEDSNDIPEGGIPEQRCTTIDLVALRDEACKRNPTWVKPPYDKAKKFMLNVKALAREFLPDDRVTACMCPFVKDLPPPALVAGVGVGVDGDSNEQVDGNQGVLAGDGAAAAERTPERNVATTSDAAAGGGGDDDDRSDWDDGTESASDYSASGDFDGDVEGEEEYDSHDDDEGQQHLDTADVGVSGVSSSGPGTLDDWTANDKSVQVTSQFKDLMSKSVIVVDVDTQTDTTLTTVTTGHDDNLVNESIVSDRGPSEREIELSDRVEELVKEVTWLRTKLAQREPEALGRLNRTIEDLKLQRNRAVQQREALLAELGRTKLQNAGTGGEQKKAQIVDTSVVDSIAGFGGHDGATRGDNRNGSPPPSSPATVRPLPSTPLDAITSASTTVPEPPMGVRTLGDLVSKPGVGGSHEKRRSKKLADITGTDRSRSHGGSDKKRRSRLGALATKDAKVKSPHTPAMPPPPKLGVLARGGKGLAVSPQTPIVGSPPSTLRPIVSPIRVLSGDVAPPLPPGPAPSLRPLMRKNSFKHAPSVGKGRISGGLQGTVARAGGIGRVVDAVVNLESDELGIDDISLLRSKTAAKRQGAAARAVEDQEEGEVDDDDFAVMQLRQVPHIEHRLMLWERTRRFDSIIGEIKSDVALFEKELTALGRSAALKGLVHALEASSIAAGDHGSAHRDGGHEVSCQNSTSPIKGMSPSSRYASGGDDSTQRQRWREESSAWERREGAVARAMAWCQWGRHRCPEVTNLSTEVGRTIGRLAEGKSLTSIVSRLMMVEREAKHTMQQLNSQEGAVWDRPLVNHLERFIKHATPVLEETTALYKSVNAAAGAIADSLCMPSVEDKDNDGDELCAADRLVDFIERLMSEYDTVVQARRTTGTGDEGGNGGDAVAARSSTTSPGSHSGPHSRFARSMSGGNLTNANTPSPTSSSVLPRTTPSPTQPSQPSQRPPSEQRPAASTSPGIHRSQSETNVIPTIPTSSRPHHRPGSPNRKRPPSPNRRPASGSRPSGLGASGGSIAASRDGGGSVAASGAGAEARAAPPGNLSRGPSFSEPRKRRGVAPSDVPNVASPKQPHDNESGSRV